jgi:S-adenosylmethionine:tRNA ribosyltransferase-isomerase
MRPAMRFRSTLFPNSVLVSRFLASTNFFSNVFGVDASQFDYHLPAEAIAQVPADRRDQSRLLVVNRENGQVGDHPFKDLPDLLQGNHRCFRNNVSVLQARLFGQRSGGGSAECLLLRPDSCHPLRWWTLLKPGKRLQEGATFGHPGYFSAQVLKKHPDGQNLVEFSLVQHRSVTDLAKALGEMPLPPYIKREGDDPRRELDRERYQTVYADATKPFAAAAPTAGLHFTREVISRMESIGHSFHDLTLHVGLGTFQPIQVENITEHHIHREFYEIPSPTRALLDDTVAQPRLAIGTTSLRAMEDYARNRHNAIHPEGAFTREADLYIYPPDEFATDALLTNFHLPRSTLLCLVSAFLTPGSTDGIQWLKQIYEAALKRGYRFYSYGDAMLIL